MPKFLTTQGLNFYLEELLKHAKKEIVIISPYVQIQLKIRELLRLQKKQGLEIQFVCRKKDLKEAIDDCSTQVHDSPFLHAKCYLTEKGALITSLNLYEFSQVKNDEMGIFVESVGDDETLYAEIQTEARRLCQSDRQTSLPPVLVEGTSYSKSELGAIFGFDFKDGAGINKTSAGELVLFNHSDKKNPEIDGVIYYCGQHTGGGEQQLLFGNRALHDCYGNAEMPIHMFKKSIYSGRYFISLAPYKDNGEWRFPLSKWVTADAP